jgi:alpha-beta hydrolase superfamily lysophospholipase
MILFCLFSSRLIAQQGVPMEIGEFAGLGGVRLCWQSWKPEGRPKAIVVMMHGGNNYCDMDGYRKLAETLVGAGYGVYSFDQRGYGRSEGERMHMGSWANIRGDFAAFLHFIRIREGNVGIYGMGLSFGALQTLDQAIVSPHLLKGIVVMSVSTISLKVPGAINVAVGVLGSVAPKTKISATPLESFPGAREFLGRQDLWADPLCPDTQTFGNLKELLKRQREIPDDLQYITIPIFHLQGLMDDIALPDETLVERCSSEDKTYKQYSNAEHEMLNSIDREQIINDILDWLERQTGNFVEE